ncbi:hypothetical protein A2121_02395 [Candidatus Nomurabacteria bacterium GWB1_40_6]|uniref:Uncharacterized protein n=1 Tax=Candidatus Nomurabacteria bacterium GWB1_40_6 TaxID=1801727 RepID=A0A1F6TK43_9BACT|nr:MAG: hypothetical protein A2121_02395 [Candidatus Nomurabacteria bacterium GWB1_40_6]
MTVFPSLYTTFSQGGHSPHSLEIPRRAVVLSLEVFPFLLAFSSTNSIVFFKEQFHERKQSVSLTETAGQGAGVTHQAEEGNRRASASAVALQADHLGQPEALASQ